MVNLATTLTAWISMLWTYTSERFAHGPTSGREKRKPPSFAPGRRGERIEELKSNEPTPDQLFCRLCSQETSSFNKTLYILHECPILTTRTLSSLCKVHTIKAIFTGSKPLPWAPRLYHKQVATTWLSGELSLFFRTLSINFYIRISSKDQFIKGKDRSKNQDGVGFYLNIYFIYFSVFLWSYYLSYV